MLAVKAFAKINFTLSVRGRRADGYHDLESVMQTLELHDRLEFVIAEHDVTLTTDSSEIPTGPDNLIIQAADLLRRRSGCRWGARIRLIKRIPVAAGLGGGSADAAAALYGLNGLWGLGFTMDKLMEFGARLGSDVPFCLLGGTALARGRGEILEPLPPAPPMGVVLVKPHYGVSTAAVYRRFDELPVPAASSDATSLLQGLKEGDFEAVAHGLHNDLEAAVFSMYPELPELKERLKEAGAAGALLAGSGPTIFGLTRSLEEAGIVASRLQNPEVGVWVTSTVGF